MASQAAEGEASDTISGGGEIPVGTPQVAYRYAYGFRLPSDAIRPLQERHADMCEAKGAEVCRIISMDQAENEGDYAYGSLTLAVRARDARTFGKELANASGKVSLGQEPLLTAGTPIGRAMTSWLRQKPLHLSRSGYVHRSTIRKLIID